MKDKISHPAQLSRTFQEKAKESKSASVFDVLQTYKNGIVEQQAVEEKDELLQGKFETTQRKVASNTTSMPDSLKTGIEQLSGLDMSDVKGHYNSSKPAKVQAYDYTQGTDTHVAPAQEEYLGHEAWHVAQQKQGHIQPNTTMGGMAVNDNAGLEKEADVMGSGALQMKWEENRPETDIGVISLKNYGSYKDVDKNDAHHTPSAYSLGCIIMNKFMCESSDNGVSKCSSDWLPNHIYSKASAIHLDDVLHARTASYGGKNTGEVNMLVKKLVDEKEETKVIMNKIVQNEKKTDENLVIEMYNEEKCKTSYDECNINDNQVSSEIDEHIKILSPPMPKMRNWSIQENQDFISIVEKLRCDESIIRIGELIPKISRMLMKSRTKIEIKDHLKKLMVRGYIK